MATVSAARKKEIFDQQMAYLDRFLEEADTEDEAYNDLDLEAEFGLKENEDQPLRRALTALKLARRLVVESAKPSSGEDETTQSLERRLTDIEGRLAALEKRLL
jgi:hypothetical protein